MIMSVKVVRKSGEDGSGSKFNEFGIFSDKSQVPKGHEDDVRKVKMLLSELFDMSQKNGGFVLIMAKDGKGNIRSSMGMSNVSSAEGMALAVDAEFKLKNLLKSIFFEQSGITQGLDIISEGIKKDDDKLTG